jgi:DNA-directed RNA polymerase specialized sigma24 family protein
MRGFEMRQTLPRKLHIEADVEADAHKELFLRYYQPLFCWALRLTDGSRARAEDLLHDAFIHFVLSRPDLNSIDNIDRYLHRSLLNLFRTQKRKAAQMQDISFNIADYDSAKLGLHAIDFQARWQAQEDLARICHYACVRKETSRAGSVLILRFFYDYSPSEIAKVALSPRRAVDDWLRLARREARFYLEDPERLKFMVGKQGESYRFKTKLTRSSDDILCELRTSILRSGRSECLSEEQLRALYQESGQAEKTIDCATLGHIVSCAGCLELVNQLLGLPSLSVRQAIEKGRSDPDEPDESDKGGAGGTGAGVGPSKAFIDRCEEQLRQIREHRPEELLFSANGDPIGALKVNSELSELRLSIHDQSPVEFIEVYSERGMRLILFSLEPGENAPVEQRAKIELSEGRTLELIFKVGGSWPSLQVIYRDPLLQEIDHALNDGPISALALVCDAGSLSEEVGSLRLEAEADVATRTADIGSERLITRLRRRLRGLRLRRRRSSWLTMLSISSESGAVHGEPEAQASTEQGDEAPRFKELEVSELGRAQDLIRSRFWEHPGFIALIFTVLLGTALFYLLMPGATAVTAASLLERARLAEDEIDRNPSLVQHRMLDLEERRPADVRVISRSRIEVWHSGAQGVRARRLYDQKSRLVAGEWTRADGSRKVYRQKGADAPRSLEVWQLELSAKDFSALIKQADVATVEETAQNYVIRYQPVVRHSILPSAELTKASITLSKHDLHTIEQTLLIQQLDGTREFRFSEASYEQRPASEVSPSVFEPERELLAEDGKLRPRDEATVVSSAPSPAPSPFTPATVELEVEVIRLLNQVDALSGEQLDVRRTSEGLLLVEGIIDTDERKQEIMRALTRVSNNPSVKIVIETPEEAARRQAPALQQSQAVISELRVADKVPPAYLGMQRYFTERGTPTDQIDRAIERFGDAAMSSSRRARQHARAMREIGGRFSPEQLGALDERALAEWRSMIREHAQAFQREAAMLRRELEPVFLHNTSSESANETQIETGLANDAELARAVGHLASLWKFVDEGVREAFSSRSDDLTTMTIELPQFWRSLKSAESLAALMQTKIQTIRR